MAKYVSVSNDIRRVASSIMTAAMTPQQAIDILSKATAQEIEQAARQTGQKTGGAVANVAMALALLFAANAAQAATTIVKVKKSETVPAAHIKGQITPAVRELQKLMQTSGVKVSIPEIDSIFSGSLAPA